MRDLGGLSVRDRSLPLQAAVVDEELLHAQLSVEQRQQLLKLQEEAHKLRDVE